jgi:hypothetical protein
MINDIKLKEEDFLQQFPRATEFMQDGLEFADWWDAGEDRTAQGKPINVADFAAMNKGLG